MQKLWKLGIGDHTLLFTAKVQFDKIRCFQRKRDVPVEAGLLDDFTKLGEADRAASVRVKQLKGRSVESIGQAQPPLEIMEFFKGDEPI